MLSCKIRWFGSEGVTGSVSNLTAQKWPSAFQVQACCFPSFIFCAQPSFSVLLPSILHLHHSSLNFGALARLALVHSSSFGSALDTFVAQNSPSTFQTQACCFSLFNFCVQPSSLVCSP